MSASYTEPSRYGTTIGDMQTPAHAKPRDHLWVLAVIAACALIETFPSWVGIGAVSGFPHLGRMPTDWTLAVTTEAYWFYGLYAGIVAAAGPRSRAFALWSAGGVFVLSLAGQAGDHLMAAAHRTAPPQWVVVLTGALPVIVLACAAFLVHLRHADRAVALDADERTAVQAEMDTLRAQLGAAQTALETAQSDRAAAQGEAAQATAKYEAMARKTAAAKARSQRAGNRAAPARSTRATEPATQVPDDVDARAEALAILAAEPGISGAQLGPRVGMSKRWGQQFKGELATAAPKGQDPEE